MRFALPVICLLFATVAFAETPNSAGRPSDQAAKTQVSERSGTPLTVAPGEGPEPSECRDRIHTVREERGLPNIERKTAQPNEYLIKAVDKRIDGCSVMVMHHDIRDVRPLPQGQPLPPRLIPLRR
jgi:hypothetical protein